MIQQGSINITTEQDNNDGVVVAIEATNLSRSFRAQNFSTILKRRAPQETIAVDNVNLNIKAGEIFGLVGPNSAGKTTLIKMLCTMLSPTSGKAKVGGFVVGRQNRQVKEIVGLVTSNERSFYWRLTGRQNMMFFAQLYNLSYRDAENWIEELFNFLDLNKFADKRFDSYSTGIKQRMAIARGLINKPKILFMDEPTKGVDPLSSNEIIDIVKEKLVKLWQPTFLITSHNLREIERLCDRIAIINLGRIVAVGTLDELRAMAEAHVTYELKLRNTTEGQVRGIINGYESIRIVRLKQRGGITDVTIEFSRDSIRFHDIIRDIIKDVGLMERCSVVENSFEDVFNHIVSNSTGKGI